jgi:hypothetical protein
MVDFPATDFGYSSACSLIRILLSAQCGGRELALENLALRQQLAVLKKTVSPTSPAENGPLVLQAAAARRNQVALPRTQGVWAGQ